MINFKKITVFFILLLQNPLLLAATPSIIRFATEATYPPFEYIDETGQIKGFDIDLAKALCAEMNAQCTFTNQAFNSLIPSLQLGKFDAVIAALGITSEREKQVAFTNAYYEPSASFVAPLDKNYSISNLTGKTIGVQQGTTFEKYLVDRFQNKVVMKSYASVQDAFLDLSSERIDLVLADTPIVQEWLKRDDNNKHYAVVEKPIVDRLYFGAGYGIAVRKNDTALQQSLNNALATIKKNGKYQKIMDTYFSTKSSS
ncbi:MAG: hypothetical protein A3E82_09320 [Gammaproteobacteria bacterium RIFCSPHIGHO2_12_FULL_38_11]|nr:MAG: hypothetical protein A3E82_09320 [Gammaproteobacteria bacterium RIFCSPHIGHO2_12_FULL_38_11]